MASRCFYFAEKELIPLILLTQRMCPPDTVSIMNCTGKEGLPKCPDTIINYSREKIKEKSS